MISSFDSLPKDWEIVLGKDIFSQSNVRVKDSTRFDSIPVLSMTRYNGLILQSKKFDKQVASRDLSNYKVVTKGQLVYGFPIDEGVIAVQHRYPLGAVSPAYHVWDIIRDVDLTYLDLALKTPFMIENYSKFASNVVHRRRNLSPSDFLKVKIPLPPLAEQRAIARVLTTVRQAIEATERVIEATRQLKKAMMKHLFTYGPVPVHAVDAVQLKETEIGWVPEGWEILTVGEVCEIKGGKRLPKGHSFSETQSPYPYIRVTDFENGSVRVEEVRYIRQEDYQRIKNYIIRCDDVYISIAGTIGLVGIVPEILDRANLTENAAKMIIRNKTRLRRDFLSNYLASEIAQKEISSRTMKTSQPKLALARIKQIPMILPPLDEQDAIVRTINSINGKIEIENQRKSSLEALFQSALHQLMTGKTRVNDLQL